MKNPNFSQKSKFWSKIQVLIKNPNFDQKSKFWSKIDILGQNGNFIGNIWRISKSQICGTKIYYLCFLGIYS